MEFSLMATTKSAYLVSKLYHVGENSQSFQRKLISLEKYLAKTIKEGEKHAPPPGLVWLNIFDQCFPPSFSILRSEGLLDFSN